MRYQYVCPSCANTVPAERVERRVPGSKAMSRVAVAVVCEADDREMQREPVAPKRREVGGDWGS